MPSRTAWRAPPARSPAGRSGARTPTAEPNPGAAAGRRPGDVAGALRRQGDAHDRRRDRDLLPHRARHRRAQRTGRARRRRSPPWATPSSAWRWSTRGSANFKQADPEWLLADNQMNHALVIGESIKNWKSLDWAEPAGEGSSIDGKTDRRPEGRARRRRSGAAARLDDRPRGALRGGIREGQAITTGSWTGLRYFPPGTRARRVHGAGARSGRSSCETSAPPQHRPRRGWHCCLPMRIAGHTLHR